MSASHVTTHVLDTGSGKPAAGVEASLFQRTDGGWALLGSGVTDADGRIRSLGPARLASGTYRIEFGTGSYFAGAGIESFFPEVAISFRVGSEAPHYHVPLLLSPFAFSTYRGS